MLTGFLVLIIQSCNSTIFPNTNKLKLKRYSDNYTVKKHGNLLNNPHKRKRVVQRIIQVWLYQSQRKNRPFALGNY